MKFNPECGGEGQFEQGNKFALLNPRARIEAMEKGINPEVSVAIKRGKIPDVFARATAEIFNGLPRLPKTEIAKLSSRLQEIVNKAARELMKE